MNYVQNCSGPALSIPPFISLFVTLYCINQPGCFKVVLIHCRLTNKSLGITIGEQIVFFLPCTSRHSRFLAKVVISIVPEDFAVLSSFPQADDYQDMMNVNGSVKDTHSRADLGLLTGVSGNNAPRSTLVPVVYSAHLERLSIGIPRHFDPSSYPKRSFQPSHLFQTVGLCGLIIDSSFTINKDS